MPRRPNHYLSIKERAIKDPRVVLRLFETIIATYLTCDFTKGKATLRQLIHSTIGFTELSEKMEISSKSLHRMVGPKGNPQTEYFFKILSVLQHESGVQVSGKAQSEYNH